MSKALTSGMVSHLAQTVTTLAMCWHVTRKDGTEYFFTNHDQDIVFQGHTYIASTGFQQTAITSTTGLSVDNLEVDAILDSSSITSVDLRAGKFDFAKVEIFLVNWGKNTLLVYPTLHSFNPSAHVSRINNLLLNSDGTKAYLQDATGPNTYQYTLGTPYDITTATYDSKVYNYSDSMNMTFLKADETKLYFAGNDEVVHRYSMTPGDITTATDDSNSFDTSTQISYLADIMFSPDGANMYASDGDNNILFQYTLVTPWDLTSIPAAPLFNPSAQVNSITEAPFSVDGFTMYVADYASSRVWQYTLGTAWDVTTAVYSAKTISLNTQLTFNGLVAIKFKSDGTKLYAADWRDLKIYQYTLSTPWDISTATYDTVLFDTSSQTSSLQDIRFKPDGTIMYVGDYNASTIWQYTLGTAWDLSTAVYASKSFVSPELTSHFDNLEGSFLKSDGTKLYIAGYHNPVIYQYTLSTPWDISTATYDNKSFTASIGTFNLANIEMASDGATVYISSYATNSIYPYTLSTPWDISTAFTPGAASFNPVPSTSMSELQNARFKSDGTKMFLSDSGNTKIFQFTLGTPWDITTAVYDNVSLDTTFVTPGINDFRFSDNGLIIYLNNWGGSVNILYQFSLQVAWDISSVFSLSTLVENTDGKIQLRTGRIGEVMVTPSGIFKSELRGLAQQYSQKIIDLYTPDCRTDLGSPKCKVPIEPPVRTNLLTCSVSAYGDPGTTIRVATTTGVGSQVYQDVYYECTSAGTTGASAPTYDPVVGHTTTETGIKASAVMTFWSQASNTGTVTIDTKVYTFQTTLTNIDGHVFRGASAADSCANLLAALTLGAGSGTAYAAATTAHPTVDASTNSAIAINLTAKTSGSAGNLIALHGIAFQVTFGVDFLTLTNSTLLGGVNGAVFTARDAWTRAGVVASVTDHKTFSITVIEPRAIDDWFNGGVLTWESGNNVGTSMEIKGWVNSGTVLTLYLGMPFTIQVGDVFRLYPGCDKRATTCITVWNNIHNFRGEQYVPGQDLVFNYPNAK